MTVTGDMRGQATAATRGAKSAAEPPRGHECGPYCRDGRHAVVGWGVLDTDRAAAGFAAIFARWGWRLAGCTPAPEAPRPGRWPGFAGGRFVARATPPPTHRAYLLIIEGVAP